MTQRSYNVSVYSNRIGIDLFPLFDYAHAYNAKHGIDLIFTLEDIDVHGYASSEFREIRPGVHYCILQGSESLFPLDPKGDIHIFVFDQDEWRTPPGSQYPLLPDTPTSDCKLVNNKPYINFGIYPPQMNNAEIVLIHELMHAFNKIAVLEGYPIIDNMDLMLVNGVEEQYYLNDQPDNPNSNFINQWEQYFHTGFLHV